ncbi:MAG: DEAD/DEAH box helicase, partial [Clostridiales bacterium]|nr:DEAD/DEAH box helicase [Clostridiales bacterium]
MEAFLAPLKEMAEFEEISKNLSHSKSVALQGCVDSQKLHMIYGLGDGENNKIIVTYSEQKARELYEDSLLYDQNVVVFPAKDLIFFQADIHGNQLVTERMKCYRKLLEKKRLTVITTFSSLMTPQIPLSVLTNHVIKIDKKTAIVEKKLAEKLVVMGYENNFQVEAPGQFSIRGGIIDIFDLTEENPYRIELWGDEVESIRSFDVLSQRSIEMKKEITIYPATEIILDQGAVFDGMKLIEEDALKCSDTFRKAFKTEEAHRIMTQWNELKDQVTQFHSYANLESYIKYFFAETISFLELFERDKTNVYLEEPSRILEHARAVELEFRESMIHRGEKGYALPGQMDLLTGVEKTLGKISRYPLVTLSSIDRQHHLIHTDFQYDITARSIPSYGNSFEGLIKDLTKYRKNGYRIILLSASRTRAKRLAEDIMEEGITCFYSEDPDRIVQPGEVMTFYGRVLRGFEYPLLKFVLISESDIFGAEKKKKKKHKSFDGQKINDFGELKVGDYVVHENHGLGIYKGIEKVVVDKVSKDYIKIQYRDGGNLKNLATGLDVIQKYASSDAKKPKLNKLGSQEWTKTKTRVKSAVSEVAKDLVELYAIRQAKEGFVYGPDTIWQREFEELFPFDETEDQLMAIEATKSDMESKKIMDRLICGDVGYGKTEIAIRAAFKAVQEGKQVVYLVPTTILAQQHYNTFVQRMKDFPVRVDLLCRFRTPAQQKKTVTDLKKGMVDIVIGTHRVLSADINYKDLGLLIIDE